MSAADGQPLPKRRKITDFFSRSTPQQFPDSLRRFQPTDVLRRPRRAVGRPRKAPLAANASTATSSSQSGEGEKEDETKSKRAMVYRSYSLRQKIEVVKYAREHSETAASQRYGIPRSTIYGWKNIDKEPIETAKNKKFPAAKKGKHTKKGAGRHISYGQDIEEELITWVLMQRDLQIPVRRRDIQLKAKALIGPEHPDFKASNGWVEKFMCRHSLSLR